MTLKMWNRRPKRTKFTKFTVNGLMFITHAERCTAGISFFIKTMKMHLSSAAARKSLRLHHSLNFVHNINHVVSDRKIESCCKRREQSNTMAWCVHVTAEAGKSHHQELIRSSIHTEVVWFYINNTYDTII